MDTTTMGMPGQQIGQIGKTSTYSLNAGTYGGTAAQNLPGTYQKSANAYPQSNARSAATSTTGFANKSGNYPEKKFRAGSISATVWVNKAQPVNGVQGEYKTVSLERSYTDKEGKWQSTNALRVNDVPKAAAALQKAYEYLVLQEQDLFKGGR